MDGLETTSLLFGTIVAVLTLLSSVWYTAVSVNNRNRDIDSLTENFTNIREGLNGIDSMLSGRDERLDDIERILEGVIQGMVKLIYVNSDHILLESHEGRVIKVPMISKEMRVS